jgi:gas vesicle protein
MIRMPKTKQNTSLSTVAVAALVGGLAGAVVGLLFAPKSGKELRQGIQEKADNVLEHVEDITLHHAGALKQQGTDLVDKGKQLAEDLQTFIQESLRIKKADYIPINIAKDTQTNESLQPQTETEVAPQILVQPEDPLKEE